MSSDDAEARAYVALANQFLDTETRDSLPTVALACLDAGWDLVRTRRAFFHEIVPLVGHNLWFAAGEWGGWDESWLVGEARSRHEARAGFGVVGEAVARALVPGASATWSSLERFHRILEAAAPTERRVLAEAHAYCAGVYVDLYERDIAYLSDAAREALRSIDSSFREAMAPVSDSDTREHGEMRLSTLRTQIANRAANKVDLVPVLASPESWTALLGLPFQLPGSVARALAFSHERPRRAYHDLSHVVEVLGHYRRAPVRERESVALAILFHDAVYELGSRENEARSADLAEEALARTSLARHVPRVRELILLTGRHGAVGTAEVDHDAAIFLDCDMAILGEPEPRYAAYEAAIAAEHAHLPTLAYRRGRTRFLRKVLGRDRIYLSDFFRDERESRARENLVRALGAVSG